MNYLKCGGYWGDGLVQWVTWSSCSSEFRGTKVGSLERKSNAQKEIYDRDIKWLESADLVIAECTNPSLGVGYEMAYAEKINVPVYIFYDKSRCLLSAMLTGNSYFNIIPYEKEEEIYPIIDSILK